MSLNGLDSALKFYMSKNAVPARNALKQAPLLEYAEMQRLRITLEHLAENIVVWKIT